MVSKWKELRLDEVTELIVDCPHSTPKWTDEGIVVLRSNNIKNGRLDVSSPSYTDQDGYEKRVKRAVPQAGDLVLTREAPMGEVCQIPEGLKCCLGQRMVLIRVKEEIIDSKYLLYTLQSPYLQYQISWNEGTGTTVSNIRIPNIKAFQIPTPPITEQKAIAHILGTLDDKIELNRRMNETLEAMAQALFKSWFVDFDPVIDNALLAGNDIPELLKERAEMRQAQIDSGKANTNSKTNDLFPSEFEFTEELGWIPQGWSIANFGDLLKSTIGGDWGKPEPDEKHTIPSVIIRGTDIPDLKTGNRSAAPKRWVEAKKLKTRKLEPYDIVIEISGGSPTQSTGRSIIINENLLERLGGTVEPASFCRRFTPIDKYIGVYAGIHLQKIYDDGKMWEYQNQSTGIANFQTTSFLEREILVLPNKELIVKYYELVNPLINKMTSNQQIELAKLRDTLLPKLMSSEVRIPDAEKLVEDIEKGF